MSFTYEQIVGRLESIEIDLADRQAEFEQAARGYFRAKRDWEAELAAAFVESEGRNQEERRARALLSRMASEEYKDLIVAEAAYEGTRAVVRTLDTRASVLQSLLRAARETGA